MSKEIKKEYYDCWNEIFMNEYRDEFKVDPLDTTLYPVTLKEQIDRYAKNILFWEKRKPIIEDMSKLDGKTMAKMFICSNAISAMKERSKEKGILDIVNWRIGELSK